MREVGLMGHNFIGDLHLSNDFNIWGFAAIQFLEIRDSVYVMKWL